MLLAIMADDTVVAFLPLGFRCFSIRVAAMLVGSVLIGLDRLAAVAGFPFVLIMFTITACDVFIRTGSSARALSDGFRSL